MAEPKSFMMKRKKPACKSYIQSESSYMTFYKREMYVDTEEMSVALRTGRGKVD